MMQDGGDEPGADDARLFVMSQRSSRTDPDDDVVDTTSLSALDVRFQRNG